MKVVHFYFLFIYALILLGTALGARSPSSPAVPAAATEVATAAPVPKR